LTKTETPSTSSQATEKIKPIAITAENTEELSAVLDRIQGTARADILSVADLIHLTNAAERRLEHAGIASSYRTGATLHATPSGSGCTAYKYARAGTAVFLERKSAAWVLVRAYRLTTWPRQIGRQTLTLTPRQKQHVLRHAMKAHGITTTEAAIAIATIAKTN
jgi:hypothetical protein